MNKTSGGITTHFVYSDLDGQLLGEYNASGQPIREYIYLEGERVAMYDYSTVEPKDSSGQKAIVYLHNNQVGQVQYAFNSDGQMIYERIQTPFGETMGELNAYNLHMPVRFPGQYYDAETGFNQNWNRDYDPSLGRYVQSDPIGLAGGINTFGYVMQSPLRFIDPMGLEAYSYRVDGKLFLKDSGADKTPDFPVNADRGSCTINNKKCECPSDTKDRQQKEKEEAERKAKEPKVPDTSKWPTSESGDSNTGGDHKPYQTTAGEGGSPEATTKAEYGEQRSN